MPLSLHTLMAEQLEIIPLSPWKRAFDVIASASIIVALSPVITLFLIAILLERLFMPSTRGPLLYTETRISQGEPFTFYKLRTFKLSSISNARKNGTIHTKELEQDFRNFTPTGLALRQVYLDEFPQLFLVLIGRMTLVGPRPTNPVEYKNSIEGGLHAKRILKAGLTGRFQSHKSVKYGLNQEQTDMDYAHFCKTHSGPFIVLYDAVVCLQTILTILRAEGI